MHSLAADRALQLCWYRGFEMSSPPRIVIAMDSFKGCLSSLEAGRLVADVLSQAMPEAETNVIPTADGGEGTAEAVHQAAGGEVRTAWVTGPLGEPVEARYVLLPGAATAVMDMASASGLELVPRERRDPWIASSVGTGELMCAAMDDGVGEIVIGIGGSATVDGGLGMAEGLGYRLLDADGRACPRGGQAMTRVATINASGVRPELCDVGVRVACDVDNPLLGEHGAARVFGPQKGADAAMVEQLEAGLANLARVWRHSGLLAFVDRPGDGAAGGLGAGLRAFCRAEISPGADLVAQMTGLDAALRDADFLVTGEGRTDEQTLHGKLCWSIGRMARRAGARTVLISGAIREGLAGFESVFDAAFASVDESCPVDEALRHGRRNLEKAARRAAAWILQSEM